MSDNIESRWDGYATDELTDAVQKVVNRARSRSEADSPALVQEFFVIAMCGELSPTGNLLDGYVFIPSKSPYSRLVGLVRVADSVIENNGPFNGVDDDDDE